MATHSNILAWDIHTASNRCKSVDEILSQIFHHSDSLSDKFRAEKLLVLILLLTL